MHNNSQNCFDIIGNNNSTFSTSTIAQTHLDLRAQTSQMRRKCEDNAIYGPGIL